MLPLIVLSLALIFFLMKLSGVLDDLAAASRRRAKMRTETRARLSGRGGGEPEADRLGVFRDFIDRLPPGEEPPSRHD